MGLEKESSVFNLKDVFVEHLEIHQILVIHRLGVTSK
jgi:hypothetical protein